MQVNGSDGSQFTSTGFPLTSCGAYDMWALDNRHSCYLPRIPVGVLGPEVNSLHQDHDTGPNTVGVGDHLLEIALAVFLRLAMGVSHASDSSWYTPNPPNTRFSHWGSIERPLIRSSLGDACRRPRVT